MTDLELIHKQEKWTEEKCAGTHAWIWNPKEATGVCSMCMKVTKL